MEQVFITTGNHGLVFPGEGDSGPWVLNEEGKLGGLARRRQLALGLELCHANICGSCGHRSASRMQSYTCRRMSEQVILSLGSHALVMDFSLLECERELCLGQYQLISSVNSCNGAFFVPWVCCGLYYAGVALHRHRS